MGDVSGTLGSSLIKRIKIYGKKGESALDAFFLRWLHASGRFDTFCVPKCRTIPFLGCFWNCATSCTSVVAEKCRKNRFGGGYGIGGKTAFRQEKCCTIRNLPRKSESCNKIRRFLPWVLISWQVLAAWCPLQAWCLDGEARGSVAGAGPADRDRGGDRVRERLDHARPAHGVRGALRQEPVRPTPQGYSRRRDHARPQPKELIPRD